MPEHPLPLHGCVKCFSLSLCSLRCISYIYRVYLGALCAHRFSFFSFFFPRAREFENKCQESSRTRRRHLPRFERSFAQNKQQAKERGNSASQRHNAWLNIAPRKRERCQFGRRWRLSSSWKEDERELREREFSDSTRSAFLHGLIILKPLSEKSRSRSTSRL